MRSMRKEGLPTINTYVQDGLLTCENDAGPQEDNIPTRIIEVRLGISNCYRSGQDAN
jgi:hypothetical protein